MKLLVFAHTPPPRHGQSMTVQLLLDGFRREGSRIEAYHVNARLSKDIADIGSVRGGKLALLAKYCLRAIWLRFRFGINNFYYVPANASRAPLYRDWLVMAFCRPFYKNVIFHWHAAGLGEWLAKEAKGWERWVSRRLLHGAELSVIQAKHNPADAELLESKKIAVVTTGIQDPCPDFDRQVLPFRLKRAAQRRQGGTFQVLYLGLCYSQKGLFDLVNAVALANQRLRGTSHEVKLVVAGVFWLAAERQEFDKRTQEKDLAGAIEYKGFVSEEEKSRLLRESDCLCFPTFYEAETLGLVLLEAMAYGLPVVATNWRSLPEIVPPGYERLVPPHAPEQIATAIVSLVREEYDPRMRAHFLEHFSAERFLVKFESALLSL
jgi:glycosyltransferase involved in cell wall biosynthesis